MTNNTLPDINIFQYCLKIGMLQNCCEALAQSKTKDKLQAALKTMQATLTNVLAEMEADETPTHTKLAQYSLPKKFQEQYNALSELEDEIKKEENYKNEVKAKESLYGLFHMDEQRRSQRWSKEEARELSSLLSNEKDLLTSISKVIKVPVFFEPSPKNCEQLIKGRAGEKTIFQITLTEENIAAAQDLGEIPNKFEDYKQVADTLTTQKQRKSLQNLSHQLEQQRTILVAMSLGVSAHVNNLQTLGIQNVNLDNLHTKIKKTLSENNSLVIFSPPFFSYQSFF